MLSVTVPIVMSDSYSEDWGGKLVTEPYALEATTTLANWDTEGHLICSHGASAA